MKLVYGNLYWPNTFKNGPTYDTLKQNITCDCLIIGAGMGGALTAELLSQQNVHVVVVDKRDVANGSSCANTGLLQYTNDKSLTACIQTFGEQTGVRFYELCRDAVTQIKSISKQLEVDPWFIPRSSLYYANTEKEVDLITTEFQTLKRYGFDVELWDNKKIKSLFSFEKQAALFTHGDAEINPYRFVQSLLFSACKRNVQVYTNSEIRHYEFTPNGVVCYTPKATIKARRVVFATGYETKTLKKDRGAYLQTTYAIATKKVSNLDKLYKQSMIWGTERPYLYMRTTPDQRIIIGGLDEEIPLSSVQEHRIKSCAKKLLNEAQQLFPFSPLAIDYAWGALFGSTHDGLPYIGEHPRFPHCAFIEGYGGNGTVYSMMAARMITDWVMGKQNDDTSLFSLNRTNKPSPPAP